MVKSNMLVVIFLKIWVHFFLLENAQKIDEARLIERYYLKKNNQVRIFLFITVVNCKYG